MAADPAEKKKQLKLGYERLTSSQLDMFQLVDQFRPTPSSTWFHQLKLGFETAGSRLTSSKLDMVQLVDQFRPTPSSTWFSWLTSSVHLFARHGSAG